MYKYALHPTVIPILHSFIKNWKFLLHSTLHTCLRPSKLMTTDRQHSKDDVYTGTVVAASGSRDRQVASKAAGASARLTAIPLTLGK